MYIITVDDRIISFLNLDDVRPCCKSNGVHPLCLDFCVKTASLAKEILKVSKVCEKYSPVIDKCFEEGKKCSFLFA